MPFLFIFCARGGKNLAWFVQFACASHEVEKWWFCKRKQRKIKIQCLFLTTPHAHKQQGKRRTKNEKIKCEKSDDDEEGGGGRRRMKKERKKERKKYKIAKKKKRKSSFSIIIVIITHTSTVKNKYKCLYSINNYYLETDTNPKEEEKASMESLQIHYYIGL